MLVMDLIDLTVDAADAQPRPVQGTLLQALLEYGYYIDEIKIA